MAELFSTTSQNITQHLKNIYKEGELDKKATCKDFLQVQQKIKGVRIVKQSERVIEERFDKREDPHKRTYYWLTGEIIPLHYIISYA